MANPFIYVQLHARDLNRAVEFYGAVFDWELDQRDTPMGPYVEILTGEGGVDGGITTAQAEQPSTWVPYVLVADIRDTLERATALRAVVLRDATQLPDGSWFGMLRDPDGTLFSIRQLAEEQ